MLDIVISNRVAVRNLICAERFLPYGHDVAVARNGKRCRMKTYFNLSDAPAPEKVTLMIRMNSGQKIVGDLDGNHFSAHGGDAVGVDGRFDHHLAAPDLFHPSAHLERDV